MEPTYLGLSAVGWRVMIHSHWELILAYIIIGTVALGLPYILYLVIRDTIRRCKNRQRAPLPKPISRHLRRLKVGCIEKLGVKSSLAERKTTVPKSFGIFLGGLSSPPTVDEQRLLSQWDVLVVDPLRDGVVGGLAGCPSAAVQVLARLDVSSLAKGSSASLKNEDVIQKLSAVVEMVKTRLETADGHRPFTGLLLASFHLHFSPAVVNGLAALVGDAGLDVWLELAHPDYLDEDEARAIDMSQVHGLVYRNALLHPNGQWKNYFEMAAMRAVMRAVTAQKVAHPIALVGWETIDDEVQPDYASVVRAHKLYTFYNALSWIGPSEAQHNVEAAKMRTIHAKPLGALMWLKNEKTMEAHNLWRANNEVHAKGIDHAELLDSLEGFIPGLAGRLQLRPSTLSQRDSHELRLRTAASSTAPSPSRGSSSVSGFASDALSTSTGGGEFTGLGCFQLGHEPTWAEFEDLRRGLRKLQDLNLLARVQDEDRAKAGSQLRLLRDTSPQLLGSHAYQAVQELLDLLDTPSDESEAARRIHILSGLHSSFQTGSGVQYWGLYDVEPEGAGVTLYLSNKTEDRAATILHTFLSSKRCTRLDCFLAEQAMAEVNGGVENQWKLAPRLLRDVEKLTPSEALLLLERLHVSRHTSSLLTKIRDCLEYELLEMPTLAQQERLASVGFLSGAVEPEELVDGRLSWLANKGCAVPDREEARQLFERIQIRLYEVLMAGEGDVYAQITSVMQRLLRKGRIDSAADMIALAVFSAFRRFALDEVYLEILDRNVYPNHSSDQPGCFAEHFALGSRCDSFFGTNARDIGRILSRRYRSYYKVHQPPIREQGFTELPTTYAAMQGDFDPDYGKEKLPFYHHITFFGIFALPALFDVMLLTTIGRGLFLTTFMTSEQKTMATTALMMALLISGAFGAWICSGGSYYFFASGFPAMNLFVLTRFSAGVGLTLAVALVGFVVVVPFYGLTAALTFAFYVLMLTTYMMVLSALSIYQSPGSGFLSGRTAILCCVPLLFVSPLVSIWSGYDIVVYVSVLTAFLVSILVAARNIIGAWGSWHLKIPAVADAEIAAWYRSTSEAKALPHLDNMADQPLMDLARTAFHKAVAREANRWPWQTKSTDGLIQKMAAGYESTQFLFRWYTAHKRSRMPLAYSTTWNLMLKAATENMVKMQKGLKLHSAFLHWRSTGLDIWSGLLYFLVALTDKWVALFTGANMVGLSAASSETFRLGVGWGLCYYLAGALLLDIVSQPLWTKANDKSIRPIASLEHLEQVAAQDLAARRKLYATNLVKLFFLHLWAIALFATLMWVFQDSPENSVMFLSYVGAYSGLLFYQYNKVFCGFEGEKPLAVAVLAGFASGIALYKTASTFSYGSVISLAAATWTAGILSLFSAKRLQLSSLFVKAEKKEKERSEEQSGAITSASRCHYTAVTLEPHPDFSLSTVAKLFAAASRLSPERRYVLSPDNHPGSQITRILSAPQHRRPGSSRGGSLRAAFPAGGELLHLACETWKARKTTVELVSTSDLPPTTHAKIRALARKSGDGDLLDIVVVLAADRLEDWQLNVHQIWRLVAETIVQCTAEHRLGMSHDEAVLAALLVPSSPDEHGASISNSGDVALPEGVKYQLHAYGAERARFLTAYHQILLRWLLLGCDSELEWDGLPRRVRAFLLKRLCGHPAPWLTTEEEDWIRDRLPSGGAGDVHVWMARCELGAALTRAVFAYAQDPERDHDPFEAGGLAWLPKAGENEHPVLTEWATDGATGGKKSLPSSSRWRGVFSWAGNCFKITVKFLIISLTADPEYQRELEFVIRDKPALFRWPIKLVLNSLWIYAKAVQDFFIPVVLLRGRGTATNIQKLTRGTRTILEKSRILSESFGGPSTLFWAVARDGDGGNGGSGGSAVLRVAQYSGKHDAEPAESDRWKSLRAVSLYNSQLVLQRKELYDKGDMTMTYEYQYRDDGDSRLPIQRTCISGDSQGEVVQYDNRGYQTSGSAVRGAHGVSWKLHYRKNPKHEDELLWGEYAFPHITIKVLWSMPPRSGPQTRLEEWIPFSTVTEATFLQGDDTWHASWDYEHKFHPEVAVTLNGQPVETPKMISEDWFHVFQKPESCSFLSENPLLPFRSIQTTALSRLLGWNTKRNPIPTYVARTNLWNAWRQVPDVDAVSARWLDEKLVRDDPVMRPYWRYRNMGALTAAKAYLDAQADAVMAQVDIDPATSSWTHLAYKMADLYSFGEGGDARINTRQLESQLRDGDRELHVLAMDTSTWPNDPGGVSNCRRDMVNNLSTIRWHVVAESANDYGVPRYQIERNVHSLTILPLWGLDFLNPTHGVLETTLDSAVVERSMNTHTSDVVRDFLPILDSLVRCARAVRLDRRHIEEATRALVDLNTYFSASRNWNDVWRHPVVFARWCELWLSEDDKDNAVTISEWWDFELPTIKDLENALDLWCRYLFIFSLPVPERIPGVFQASHHFCGATYGIVCKVKRGCSLHIWDHCISFREFTTFMSSAVSYDASFTNSTLISLTHLSCVLLEHHADVVLPCCDYFNPGWEVELGTADGALEHRKRFARKIDPVVNGISNMESFRPIERIKTEKPTVVMLSHVQYPKDLKNAILACDVIVNKWGFKDYRLHMYGEKERHATIATELIELITSKNLQNHCFLMGLANPAVALQDAWLFLNSSISEGLPLAMGEAALMGVPVVCTDVGASYCVVTDRATGLRFSEVVPPNDSESLARAQISVMALVGPWAQYAGDPSGADVPDLAYPVPSPEQVRCVAARMYEKTEQRRALGLLGRENVLKNFSSERYLREHEQMLWIGKDQSPANRVARAAAQIGVDTPGRDTSLSRQTRNPRLTPQSWLSLASEKEGKKRWWSDSRSTSTSTLGIGGVQGHVMV
ncbi:glycosyl transferase [Lasiosphaeria hispida]|uniref:Glycosyl transferase n=1 Tax=Lasiosphaeria hispida TaxID=260671 RepID=A0AAJ0H891_9PEZI|nr:glycosyl transferase [Lasiosphaeria hispida]